MNDICPVCGERFTISMPYSHGRDCGVIVPPSPSYVSHCICGYRPEWIGHEKEPLWFHHLTTAHTPEDWRKLLVRHTLETMQ